jgi:hypothetical protein
MSLQWKAMWALIYRLAFFVGVSVGRYRVCAIAPVSVWKLVILDLFRLFAMGLSQAPSRYLCATALCFASSPIQNSIRDLRPCSAYQRRGKASHLRTQSRSCECSGRMHGVRAGPASEATDSLRTSAHHMLGTILALRSGSTVDGTQEINFDMEWYFHSVGHVGFP